MREIFEITEYEPTPIVKDFSTFIDYLTSHTTELTRVNNFLPKKVLYEMNQKMDLKSEATLDLGQLYYPLLHLFYNLALSGKLFIIRKEKGNFLIPTERLKLYNELNATEKYFFLLETMWIDANWKKLQGGYFGENPIYTVPGVLNYFSNKKAGEEIKIENAIIGYKISSWEYFLLYFSFFGFWEVKLEAQKIKRHIKAESIKPTSFGIKMIKILNEKRHIFLWNIPLRRMGGEWKVVPGSPLPEWSTLNEFLDKEPTAGTEPFFMAFTSLFGKKLQKTLPRKDDFIDGIYVFKVSLSKNIWRKIEISGDDTLLSLHNAIQDAFDFDSDHLYSFFMDGKPWSDERISSPFEEEYPDADEVKIGELGLYVGQEFLYLFDYGDKWHFKIKLEEIKKGDKPKEPRIIERKGKAPPQYGGW